jgi:iron complex outermembrane recepter protein
MSRITDVGRWVRRGERFHARAANRNPAHRMLARSGSIGLLMGAVLSVGALQARAQEQGDASTPAALKRLSIEQLMDVEVTSVSRTRESLMGAAAAVAIVTDEDIRRSGATTVPEALRFVPGLFVASQSASAWSVSSRGFSGVNSQDLLVLSDTRSIYTPLFSGVFWDVQDYLMEDIDRIEVIRGPGGALWGSNAVNGVINIDTKPARDTQGGYFEAGSGTQDRVTAAAQYGGELADHAYYRVFAKYSAQDSQLYPPGASPDHWRLGHLGFRSDWRPSAEDGVTFQGDLYDGNIGLVFPSANIIGRPQPEGRLAVGVSGGNVLGRWQHTFDSASDAQVRLYYDRTHRNDPSFLDDLDTIDLDVQHRLALTRHQEIMWGLSYRVMYDRNEGKGVFALTPPSSRDSLYSGFIQDQLSWRETVHLTLGTKLEHNDFSGFEAQPSVRAAWDLATTRTLWAAVSRAVRVPTRLERDVDIDVTDPAGNPVARLLGNPNFHAEQLLAFELGYRWQLSPTVFLDLASFHNRYTGLASLEFGTPFIDPATGQTIIPVVSRNLTDGRADGLECLLTYSPLPYWRLSLNYTYIDMSLDAHGMDLNRGRFAEGSTPRNQVGLRSDLDLPRGIQLELQYRALSAIESLPQSVTGEGVAGYQELDAQLAWRLARRVVLSLDGRNLLHAHHFEFGPPGQASAIRRSVYGKIAWEL